MPPSILIGDVGSTSGKWALRGDRGTTTFATPGYNPVSQGAVAWQALGEALRQRCQATDNIVYYGSGVASESLARQIGLQLQHIFPGATIEVHSDLLAAARALCGDTPGIVAILGTGSSVCTYDGTQIVHTIPSLGYPHGDEGGGWRIGLDMVRGFYYGTMPEVLRSAFHGLVPDTRQSFLESVKRSAAPNAYLASFATFAASNVAHPWVRECLFDRFKEFAKMQLSAFIGKSEVHFAGGIAKQFEEELREVLKQSGMSCGKIIGDPLPELLNYHNEKL